jgi:phosphatidylglycerol:prolipoprotein diacylglycerol transferase
MLAYFVDNFDPFIFRLWDNVGPRWYGFAYVLAFVSAYVVVRLLSRRGDCDLLPEHVSDFITWTALFGVLLGGRIGYVLFYKPEMLREPLSILRVWEGGMASHGGMIGILALSFYYAKKHKLSWTNLGDALVVAAPIGLFFGRCANFVNGELYGRVTNLSWAMLFPKELLENLDERDRAVSAAQKIDPSLLDPDAIIQAARHNSQINGILQEVLTPRHPSQLYEAFFEGIVLFAILWFVRTQMRQPNGVLTGLFFICYALFRIVCETFREPDAPLVASFTRGQFFSFFLIAIGIAFVVIAKLRPTFPKDLQPPERSRAIEAKAP